jgi:hypothetical protein
MQGIVLEQTSSRDDYLDSAKDALDKVSAKASSQLGMLNEAAVAAETDTTSETLAALL